jgi:hypothetical protein
MTEMLLTDAEVLLVLMDRKRCADILFITEMRKTCQHAWGYVGHGHNDDMYECSLCGETKWE